MSKKEKASSQAQANGSSEGDAIQVFVRVRPSEYSDTDMDFGQCLEVRLPDTVIMHSKPEPKVFTFDHVTASNTTQESVFISVGKRIIESCVSGYNGTIFAYGQTGSGKTFTMLGPCEDGNNFHHELRGIIPRSFEYLFSLVNREREKHGDRFEFLCRCSFLEIYNEQIFDLLDPASMGLHLRENMKKGVFVDGLIERTVSSATGAYDVLVAGWHNRRVAATSMNRESSRSHAVFTVSIETKEKKAGVSNIRVSQLHLVDLAGSERQKDTKAVGMRLKEAGSINKSLSILGNVIMALVDIAHGKQRHVPYRESKLSFLLRDSLGGNAKTYIIANVHPDAKCFGETLSTLKFARRAKMIKNRAVVNEDTQGNVMHLQAEIRRLREALAQQSTGSIPHGPGAPGGSQGGLNGSDAMGTLQQIGSSGKWKKYFLEAMALRDAIEVEKRELKERVQSLEELCSKRDEVIRSNKMIIKFRDSTIDMLRKSKSKAVSQEDVDAIHENLKKEIEQLREQLEHNPFAMRHVVENQALRTQNKKLRMLEAVQTGEEMLATRAQELEKSFLELREGLPKDRRISITPTSTPVDGENVATSTMVILKSQIKKLQQEVENAKQEHTEQEELSRRDRLELESELASFKKTNLELEKMLEGMKARNRLERETINDLHMETIKKITTPKKVLYNLRSRLIARANGTPVRSLSANSYTADNDAGAPSMSNSPGMDQEGIIEEDMPDHLMEQCNEALTAELQKWQEKTVALQKSLEDHESEKHKVTQNLAKVEHQLQQITELHSTESQMWSEQEKCLMARLDELTGQLTTVRRDLELARGEAEDFRVMFQATDRELGAEKKQADEASQEWGKNKAGLDAQVVRLENELCHRAKEYENLMEDKEQLQDAYSTLQEEHEFQQQREEELEGRLRNKTTEIIQLQEDIQAHLEKLDSERDKSSRLMAELRQGDSTKQELLASQELIDQLREECNDLHHRLDEEAKKLCETQDDLETASSALTSLRIVEKEQQEALASLMHNLQEQKALVRERDEQLASVHMQLEDSRGRASLLEATVEEGKAAAEALQANNGALEERMKVQAVEHQEQVEKMRSEAMDMSSQQKELLKELQDQSGELTQLHQQVKEKEEEIESQRTDFQSQMQAMEAQLEEARTNLSTVVVELGGAGDDIEPGAKRRRRTLSVEDQVQELESLQESEKRFKELSVELDAMREKLTEEMRVSKMKADELEEARLSREILAAQHQTLKYEQEALTNEMREKESQLREELDALKCDMTRQKASYVNMEREKDEATQKLYSIQTALDQAKANEEILQENMDQVMEELDRTSALESAHFKDKEDIKSKLEEEREEKSKLLKEHIKLKEEMDELTNQNVKLVGHHNHKQRINYHQKVKVENQVLKEQLIRANQDLERMRREQEAMAKRLSVIMGNGAPTRPQVDKAPTATTLKENADPELGAPS